MKVEIIIVLISLISGAVGYLITTFFFKPIISFKSLRKQIISDLVFYRNAINAEGLNKSMEPRLEKRIEANRRSSSDLAAIYGELPKIYRWYLGKKEYKIDYAVPELMGLSNTREFDSAEERLKKNSRLFSN